MHRCLAINWLLVDHDDLLRGIGHVQYEWTQMAGCAARLELVDGIRTPDENATLEALLLHARCLINFLCGNYRGAWMPDDMKPADFLRAPWVLPDDEMDRRLRGRLTVINQSLAHLSWRRITNDRGVLWPTGLLAHEVHWAMHQFVEALPVHDPASVRLWAVAAAEADRWMPPRRDNWIELRGFEPAPARASSPPDGVALNED